MTQVQRLRVGETVLAVVSYAPDAGHSSRHFYRVGAGWPNHGLTQRKARWDGSCVYKETDDGSWQDMTPHDVQELRATIERQGGRSASVDIVVGGRQRSDDWEQERALIRSRATEPSGRRQPSQTWAGRGKGCSACTRSCARVSPTLRSLRS